MNMRLYVATTLAGLAIAIGWAAGCGNNSSATAPTVGLAPSTVVALVIKGNAALTGPGQTTQLSAEATLSDGSRRDVTSATNWSSSNGNVVTISQTGLVTGVNLGRASILAYAPPTSRSATLSVTVLPPGAYILSGRVTEVGNYPLADARVELVGGPMSGRAAMTNQSGDYVFNGVSGVQQVQATKAGYVAAAQPVPQDTEHVNLDLTPSTPYASVGGTYRLTFKASDSCHLPDEAGRRSYTATIRQVSPGAVLAVTLSDAQFGTYFSQTWNSFSGRVLGNAVSFTLNDGYDALYLGGVAEKLAETRYLMLGGRAAATVTGSTIPATFAGAVSLITSPNNIWGPSVTCAAPDHQLIFTKS